ncbi:hypothetical protein [Massilia sp. TSP1-1-2]|uniref:hypothetical protein n=1 Tax=unclassified Massilia TaxID=2609279 RepID=UPI003CEB9557
MKKLFPFLLLFIMAMWIWDATFDPWQMSFNIDDADADGPLGALLAGGGLLVAMVALVVAAVVTAVVCAGVGIVVIVAVVLAAIAAVLALSPLMLPVLIPVAIICYLSRRDKRRHHDLKQRAGS